MFAVGHLALGYLTGKATAKLLNTDVNIPLVFFVSVLPDIDFLVGLEHRGPTHSLVLYVLVFLPFWMLYGRKTIVYFVSLSQHALLGDLLTLGGAQILWPLTFKWFSLGIRITSLVNVYSEWTAFLLSLGLMFKARDVQVLFQHHSKNLLLTAPVFAIILPVFFSFPLTVPVGLLVPHAVFLALLGASILIDVRGAIEE